MIEMHVDGKTATIDDCDIDLAVCHNWHLSKAKGRKDYVYCKIGGRNQYLARIIGQRMGFDAAKEVDHKDLDTMNNCRSNLREATGSQNLYNRECQSNNKLGLKGVSFHKGRYRAVLGSKHLGYFDSALEASEAYRVANEKQNGEFARM